jgi:O-antigen ligase
MPINWNNIKDKVNYYLIILIAFFLPLYKEVIPPLITLFFLSSIINKKKGLLSSLTSHSYFIIIGFYLLGLFSLIYGKDINNTLFNNEIKLSLFVLPLSFIISNHDLKNSFRAIFKAFIEGSLVAISLNLLNASISYYYEGKLEAFFYDQLSYFSHASYFSMYLNFAIALLYYFWFSPSRKDYIKPKVNFSLSIVFSVFVLMLSSKTGILTLLLVHFIAGIYWFIQYKKFKQGLVLVISMFCIIGISLVYSPRTLERINLMIDSIENYDGTPNTSTKIRLAVWTESFSLIKERPLFGYGTGDVSNVLTERYYEKGFYDLAKKHLNSHNQFIQILIGSGVFGLLYFLIMIGAPFKNNFTPPQLLIYFLFLVLIIINFMTESMLETQSGVIFFSFFITIFYTISNPKETRISKV